MATTFARDASEEDASTPQTRAGLPASPPGATLCALLGFEESGLRAEGGGRRLGAQPLPQRHRGCAQPRGAPSGTMRCGS